MSSEVNNWFSATELSLIGEGSEIGLPATMQGCKWRAKKEEWLSRQVKGSGGPGGIRTEYQPPSNVLALIQSYLAANPDFFAKSKTRTRADLAKISKEIFGDAPARLAAAQRARQDNAAYGDSVFIDQYVNVSGSAGPGSEVNDEAIVKVRVDTHLLRERVGSNFSHIKIAAVSGDSMEPTLSHGDQVLVDTSCNRFIDNAIYAIQQDGHLRFKRIQLKLDGSIMVKSDGTSDVETYTAEQAQQFFVVGMIIPFKFGRFKV